MLQISSCILTQSISCQSASFSCWTMDSLCEFLQGALLVGGPATAKTTVKHQFLLHFDTEATSSKTITSLYLTSLPIFQMSVEVRRAAI